MKFTLDIEINLPKEKVVELFNSSEYIFEWMEGLKSFEHLEGTAGEVGSKSKMVFKLGNKDMEMIEIITHADWPHSFHAHYEAKGAVVEVENYFEQLPKGNTKYKMNQGFEFDSWIPRLLGKIAPGIFKKQSLKNMIAFKKWAENRNV